MARRIFEDHDGLYFRAYDKNRRLVKVYCDEEGNPIKGKRVVPIVLEEEEEVGVGFPFKRLLPILVSLFLAALVIFGGIFAYNKFFNANPKVDISNGYDISFTPTGFNGEAKAGIKVNKIPTVENVEDEAKKKAIEDILNNPRVSYNKTEGLRNGDNIEVTVVLDETKVKANKLEVTGTYKKTFQVSSLGDKPALESINPGGANQSANERSEESSTTRAARRTAASEENSSNVPTGVIPVPRTVKPAAVNVRSGAGTGNAVAGNLRRGGTVTEIRRVENAKGETWSQVKYGNGKTGWIRSDLLS